VVIYTGDSTYLAALRPRITFKSLDGLTTYFTFNAFSDTNPFVVTLLDVEGAVGESGTFNITIKDFNNVIDESGLRAAKIYIELGKSEATLKFFMIGFADIFNTTRPQTNDLEYTLTGFGSAIQASQLFIHRRAASNITDIASTPNPIVDHNYDVWKLAKSALEDKNWRPLKDTSIQNLTHWSTAGISNKIKINFPVVNAPFTYLSDFLDQLCSISGAVWFVDFSTGSEIFYLSYNADLVTGVTIKSGDLRVPLSDDATKTGYIKRAFNVEDSSTSESGVSTRLYTTTIIDRQIVTQSIAKTGSTTLNNRALAQQFIIDNDARRITDLGFIMHKIGDPESPKDRINGELVLDANNKPEGTKICSFTIPLSDIDSAPQMIFVNDVNIKQRFLQDTGQNKIWVRFFQRSGNDAFDFPPGKHLGDPINDSSNTIAWHHNNVFNTVGTLYSGTAPGGDKDLADSLVWTTVNTGPTYTFSIMSNIRRLQSRTNQQAASILRMREQFIPTEFLSDPSMVDRFLSLNLSQMAKPKRAIQNYLVTIPNDFIYKPYQFVTFVDGLSGIAQDLQVKRVRYTCSSAQGDTPIGALHAEISVGGSYNPLLGDCSCA